MTDVPLPGSDRGFTPACLRAWRALAGVWAAAWSAFALASAGGQDWRGSVIAAGFVAGVCVPVSIACRFPRAGGLVLGALGLWGWGFFDSRAAMIGLLAPALALGAGFVTIGMAEAWRRTRMRRRGAAR